MASKRNPAKREQTFKEKFASRRKKAAGYIMKHKKATAATAICFVAAIILAVITFSVIIPSCNYDKAKSLIAKGEYKKAYTILAELGDYKDSSDLRKDFTWIAQSEKLTYPNILGEFVTRKELDEKGNCIFQITSSPDSDQSLTENQYDEKGNCIKRRITDPESEREITYSYDYEGEFITEMKVTQSGQADILSKYEYDKNGNCIKTITIMPGNKENIQTNEYDSKGNKISTVTKTAGGYEETVSYSYDKNGNCTKKETKTKDNEVKETVTNKYDENGNLKKKITKNADGDTETVTYKLDKNGICIKETTIDNSGTATTLYSDYKVFYKN